MGLLFNSTQGAETVLLKQNRNDKITKRPQDSVLMDSFLKSLARVQLYKDYSNGCLGYRIQVINTNKKAAAIEVMNTLNLLIPEEEVFFVYREPYYRVRIGAYRSEEESELLREKIDMYYKKKFAVVTVPEMFSFKECLQKFAKRQTNDFFAPLPIKANVAPELSIGL